VDTVRLSLLAKQNQPDTMFSKLALSRWLHLRFERLLMTRRKGCVTVGVCLLWAAAVSTLQADVGKLQLADDVQAAWLRRVVTLDAASNGTPTHLLLTGDAVVSVYFNGQQLSRNERLKTEQVVQFDVSDLVRNGRNGLAIAVSRAGDGRPAVVSVWVNHNGKSGLAGTGKGWKQKNDAPPVGWQNTDFNPHQWADVGELESVDMSRLAAAETREWRRPTIEANHESPLRLNDRDHVVVLGGTFIERSQLYGHIESMLAARAGSKRVTFRNLGWSGDTVYAESRGIFETPAKGYQQMVEHVRAEEPTLIVLCYGQNEAMTDAGKPAVEQFGNQLRKLHRDLQTTGARFLFVTPHPLLYAAPPIPSPTRFNRAIEDYAVKLRDVAAELDEPFADLFSDFPGGMANAQNLLAPAELFDGDLKTASPKWTDNGMHFNDAGYKRLAMMFAERCFDETVTPAQLIIDTQAQTVAGAGVEVRNVRWDQKELTMEVRSDFVRATPVGIMLKGGGDYTTAELVQMDGLKLDSADMMHSGGAATTYVADPQYDVLRELVCRKNELYFHRWRPQNITYLYLFRKHEQGNNAAEIAMFDPLVDDLEEQIHEVQQPVWRRLVLRYSVLR
jgi:lysophospholipase L1-like esterase